MKNPQVEIYDSRFEVVEVDDSYEPKYHILQTLCCSYCNWVADFKQVFRDCGFGDGELISGRSWEGGCPKCGKQLSGQVEMFWMDDKEDGSHEFIFAWKEKPYKRKEK